MSKYYILLADDDEDDRTYFREGLAELNFPDHILDEVQNGEEVIRVLESCAELPNLIVLDHFMPRMNGEETLIYLKSQLKYLHIPIAICSGTIFHKFQEMFMAKGAISVHTKPQKINEYKTLVNDILNSVAGDEKLVASN